MCWLSITTGGRGWLCSNGHICSASQGLTLAARPHLPRNGGLHPLPRTHTQRHAPAFHQALFHRRQARGLQDRCGHIPKRLRARRERRHGRAKRLPNAYDADRKTTRGLLPQAGHAAGSAHDEGRDGRAREHARGLQHHHQGAGRPLCARRLDTTSQAQRRAQHASGPARAVGQGRRPRRRAAGLRLRACRHRQPRGHLLLPLRPPRLHFLHHRRQGQRRPVRRLPALWRTARRRTFVHRGDAVQVQRQGTR